MATAPDDLARLSRPDLESETRQAVAKAKAEAARAGANQRKAEAATDRADAAEALAEAERRRAETAAAALAQIYGSLSWRLTAPLRRVSAGLRTASARLKGGMRPFLARTAAALAANPASKALVSLLLMLFPPLRERLRAAVRGHFAAGEPLRGRPRFQNPKTFASAHPDDAAPDQLGPFVPPAPKGRRILYVYVDHTILCPTHTGVQRVTRGVGLGLAAVGEEIRYVKWDAAAKACVLISRTDREHLARWSGPPISAEEKALYPKPNAAPEPIQVGPKGENHWLIVPEVTHLTYHAQPATLDLILWGRRSGLKIGFVFYDAIPLRRPELARVRPTHETYMQQIRLADVIWPISDWSGRDLLAFWRTRERADASTTPEVRTIPLPGAGGMEARPCAPSETSPLILSVGSIEPRKNQLALVRAFQAYRLAHPDSPWRLTLVGNLHPDVAQELAQATAADPQIQHLGHVPEAKLETLFSQCAFTVFPSLEEGFGLPILESLWRGKPCLCADFGAMAEVAEGGGCHTVDTADPAALAAALARLIDDEAYRSKLASEIAGRSWTSWADYGQAISARIDREGDPVGQLGPIYYWVDATVEFSRNTGIQRVARQLARSLIEAGAKLIPVKFDIAAKAFVPVTAAEKAHLAKWNGPEAESWQRWVEPGKTRSPASFFMPELPLSLSTADQAGIVEFAKRRGLKTAAIFYDASPWKLNPLHADLYTDTYARRHFEYMSLFTHYDLVLPISSFSGRDLIDILGFSADKPQSLQSLVVDAPLPCEFPGVPRVVEIKPRADEAAPIEVLCVGTVEPRKNHILLAEAFAQAAARSSTPMRLTLAGGGVSKPLTEHVNALIAGCPSIRWEQSVDDQRLHELFDACDLSIYPSLEEGFGLPIAESLWYAKPCICADFGAMAEVAEGGGCLTVDVRDREALADAIQKLVEDKALRAKLAGEAICRPVKSWRDYAVEIAARMAERSDPQSTPTLSLSAAETSQRAAGMTLRRRPKLSVCISTYNRAEWLSASLRNWRRLYPEPLDGVELLVCDNTSTDHTPQVVEPYAGRSDFSYHRNPANVGMLGNLRETAHHAQGDYIWILGDDDLIMPGAIERVLEAIDRHPDVALVYLNYAFTRLEDARTIKDFDAFFAEATPIVPSEPDRSGPIREICARNENFFTAIYTLVFRRDHALNAYSQDTGGRPFSTMLTAIPTTYYALHHMMDAPGVWIGAPLLVVNMNVSWMRYAPLWILERIPEVYEIAEQKGVPAEDIDRWRRHTLPGVLSFFDEIFTHDPLNNAAYFSPARLVRRFKHLPEFTAALPRLAETYVRAHQEGRPAAVAPPSKVFPEGH